MKRVFAHLGFSAAVMLLILNFFSVTFAYIALGVALAALCLVLSVPRLRQGVSVWLCLVGAVVACVTFIVGVHAAYLPQQKLVGQTAQVQFYVTDVRRGAEKNYYTVKTTAIDLPGVPQNIRSTFSAHADLGDVPDGIYTGKVTFASTGENGYAARASSATANSSAARLPGCVRPTSLHPAAQWRLSKCATPSAAALLPCCPGIVVRWQRR